MAQAVHCTALYALYVASYALPALQLTWAIVILPTLCANGAAVWLIVARVAVSAQVLVFHNAADRFATSVVGDRKVTRNKQVGAAGDIIALGDWASHGQQDVCINLYSMHGTQQ